MQTFIVITDLVFVLRHRLKQKRLDVLFSERKLMYVNHRQILTSAFFASLAI